MIAYKFLAEGAVGRFGGVAWPPPRGRGPGEWLHAGGRTEPCRSGIHACRAEQLPEWLDDELYAIELAGRVVEHETALVASRGRLVGRLEGWTPAAAQEFARACTWRARDRAAALLRRSGEDARGLLAAPSLAALARAAAAGAAREGPAGTACGYVADCVALLAGARPDDWAAAAPRPVSPGALAANLGFVGAHVAGFAAESTGGRYEDGFRAERGDQRAWLLERLELAPLR